MAFSQQVKLSGIKDTSAAKKANVNNATQRTVGAISKATGMKPTAVLKAKSIGATKGSNSAAYKNATNSLAEGEPKVQKRIESALNARNKASKKCK